MRFLEIGLTESADNVQLCRTSDENDCCVFGIDRKSRERSGMAMEISFRKDDRDKFQSSNWARLIYYVIRGQHVGAEWQEKIWSCQGATSNVLNVQLTVTERVLCEYHVKHP